MKQAYVGVWASPTPPRRPASFLAVAIFSSLLESRSGSSMRKSFAVCETFALTPFPSPWIPSAPEGLSAGTGRPGRRHSHQWRRGPPLPALRCAQRGASVATGGCARVRGGGGGRPRPFGMLTGRGREAARRDHQPQLVCVLMTRDARSPAEKCLPDQSLGMAPVKAPRTRQFRGTGWPSEGQKRSPCPTGARRARFPAGPLAG